MESCRACDVVAWILLHGTHVSLNSVSIKSITRWVRIFKIHMIYTYTDYTIYMNTLISFHHTKQASSCLRTILPLCHVASLNVSVYAPVVVTSNDKQCKLCSKKTRVRVYARHVPGGAGVCVRACVLSILCLPPP